MIEKGHSGKVKTVLLVIAILSVGILYILALLFINRPTIVD